MGFVKGWREWMDFLFASGKMVVEMMRRQAVCGPALRVGVGKGNGASWMRYVLDFRYNVVTSACVGGDSVLL